MKLLVVGAGSIGTRHARNAQTLGVTQIAVVDPHEERRLQLSQSIGATAFASVEAGLAWGPEAAVICSPPAHHIPAAAACAAAGCHLLIEKPLAVSREGVDALAATVAAQRLRASVAYQLRFHPAVARMRELVQRSQVGRLLSVQAEYGQYLPTWRPSRDYRDTYTAQAAQGGGILLDGSHEFDYVRWIAGEVTSVYAAAGHLSDLALDVEDTAAVVLRFQNQALGAVHLDCVQRGYSRRCTLIGTEATVKWEVASGLHITDADGSTRTEALVPQPNDPYLAEMSAFLNGGALESSLASLADGRRTLDVILAARASAASRAEVSL